MCNAVFKKVVVALGVLLLCSSSLFAKPNESFDWNSFGQIPVMHSGRLKPLDTVARNTLLFLHGKQSVRLDQGELLPLEWLMQMMARDAQVDTYPVFRIDHPDVLALIGHKPEDGKYYSFKDMLPYLTLIDQQAEQFQKVQSADRNAYQRALLLMFQRLTVYVQLKNTFLAENGIKADQEFMMFQGAATYGARLTHVDVAHAAALTPQDKMMLDELLVFLKKFHYLSQSAAFLPIPPALSAKPTQWGNFGEALLEIFQSKTMSPAATSYVEMISGYQSKDAQRFNTAAVSFSEQLTQRFPSEMRLVKIEFYFNQISPFYLSMVLYVVVALLVAVSWLIWPNLLGKGAYGLLIFAFLLHTAGLIFRMVIQGRPPVTNLYSSAVFVGWVAILVGMILERFSKRGILTFVSAIVGFLTLIIAHHLSLQGDTLEMMQAVLDSNFWLSTHVVTITMGYGAMFLMGILAHVYIIRRLLRVPAQDSLQKSIFSMVFGIACFALFFSFVGTVLGGIWADQSWGRFWGWDPKENGAVLIVLWLAIMLHARWGGMVRERGLAVMAVFGNIVTAFSWFGVNMLGVGLHSYGFMDHAFLWLIIFCIAELFIMWLGFAPVVERDV